MKMMGRRYDQEFKVSAVAELEGGNLARSSSFPPAPSVSSHPHQRAGRRRLRPGFPWPFPARGTWDLRQAFVRSASVSATRAIS